MAVACLVAAPARSFAAALRCTEFSGWRCVTLLFWATLPLVLAKPCFPLHTCVTRTPVAHLRDKICAASPATHPSKQVIAVCVCVFLGNLPNLRFPFLLLSQTLPIDFGPSNIQVLRPQHLGWGISLQAPGASGFKPASKRGTLKMSASAFQLEASLVSEKGFSALITALGKSKKWQKAPLGQKRPSPIGEPK